MCDPLGNNLLPLIWFTKDFEGESTSSLGIFFFFLGCMGLTGEESFASLLGMFWRRIFCLLTEDLL